MDGMQAPSYALVEQAAQALARAMAPHWPKVVILRQDMAKALQRLIAASADPVQAYAMSWLKDKMQYASPMRKFREAVSAAVDELKRVGVIARGEIDVGRRGSAQLVLNSSSPICAVW